MEDVQTDPSAVRGWLSALHGSSPGYITINWAPIGGGWHYEWFDTSDGGLEAAVDCASSATGVGIYVSTCSYVQPSPVGRGRATDTLALPGLWADLDLAGPGHAAPGNGLSLLPDMEAARRVVAHLPPPTLWVHSGGGLYPWWLLREPRLLTEGNRAEVQLFSRRWHQSISAAAADLGWHVGDTGDLARVLRVPGTINRKEGLARACRLLEEQGPRYDLGELAVVLEDAVTRRRPALVVDSVGLTEHVADRKGSGPFDALEDTAQWSDILPRDWTLVRTEADGAQLWRRPGDPSSDYSARAELGGKHLITVFSDAAGLPVGRPMSMGQVFAELHHRGDSSEAARDLLRAAGAHPGATAAARSLPQEVIHAIAQTCHLITEKEPMPEPDFFESVPIPLTDRRTLPPFPVAALPAGVTEMVAAVAEFSQTDPGMAGTCAVSMLAAAIGGRVELEARPGWQEPLNLYTATVASPGERKSAVQNEMAAPLRAVEKELVQAGEAARMEAEIQRDVALEAAKKAQKAAGHARGQQQRDAELAEAVAAQMHAQAITVPPLPRLIADDATSEAVATLLVEQNGRLAVLSSEGGIFDVIAGRYNPSSAPNLDVWLKGHAGDPLRVDRKGRPPEHVDRPALTVALMIQPAVLTAIARNDAFRGRGLLARFLYALPGSRVGSRRIRTAPVPHLSRSAYEVVIRTLARTLAHLPQPVVIRFEELAEERLLTYAEQVESQLAPGGELGHVAEWGNKLVGATVRLAGLLHMADHPTDGCQRRVGLGALERAILLADYYRGHALAAFDQMRADPIVADAEYLIDVLRRLGLPEVSKRDLHVKSSRARFAKVNELDPPLALLESTGHLLRRPPATRTGRGRPPSPTWFVHPSVLTETTQATEATNPAGSAA